MAASSAPLTMVAVHGHIAAQQRELERLQAEAAAMHEAVAADAAAVHQLARKADQTLATAISVESAVAGNRAVLATRVLAGERLLQQVAVQARDAKRLQKTSDALSRARSKFQQSQQMIAGRDTHTAPETALLRTSLVTRSAAVRTEGGKRQQALIQARDIAELSAAASKASVVAAANARAALAMLGERQALSSEEAATRRDRIACIKTRLVGIEPGGAAAAAKLRMAVGRQRAAASAALHYRKAHALRLQQVREANNRLHRAAGITFPVPATLQSGICVKPA